MPSVTDTSFVRGGRHQYCRKGFPYIELTAAFRKLISLPAGATHCYKPFSYKNNDEGTATIYGALTRC